jgi:hydrogenase large subunit
MTRKLVIDPITKLSGLLKVEVTIENNKITNAKCTGNVFPGFDSMLIGKSPLERGKFSERICAESSISHNYVSCLAIENALGITCNYNTNVIRDYIHGCEFLKKHIRHFYTFVLPDYIKGPPISSIYNGESNDYRVPYFVNERLAGHYVEGFKYSSMAHHMMGIIGGEGPRKYGINIGDTTVNFDASQYVEVNSILKNIADFIKEVMLEDIDIVSMYYSDYFEKGGTGNNYLSYGVFDNYSDSRAS